MATFEFHEATFDRWPDFERLCGANGACGGCWCQHWRVPRGGKLWDEMKGEPARKQMKKLFADNTITGLLAYDGRDAVGWCSYGPRGNFPRLDNTKAYRRNDTAGVWSINCFFIDKNYRGKGLARMILKAALKFLRARNVKIVEAYPVTLTKDGKKLPAAFSFTGPLQMFLDEGFEIIQHIAPSRPLVRKRIKSGE